MNPDPEGRLDDRRYCPRARLSLGTPLSPSAVRVPLLGAGELGREVIIALQRLGVEVIPADRYPNAPGHQVAHRAHVLNMADPWRCEASSNLNGRR